MIRKIVGKIGFLVILTFLVSIALSTSVHAQFELNSEHIETYEVTIEIQKDGMLHINEEIEYDFASLQRHGIKRWIPLGFKDADKEYRMKMSDIHVTDEYDKKIKFETSSIDGIYELKIGDPNREITGKHTYNIEYLIAGGMRYFDTHDELYWNAIGTDWQVPISHATIHVIYPDGISVEKMEMSCFMGVQGASQEACQIIIKDSEVVFTPPRELQSYEGTTVVVGLPAGSIAKLLPQEYIPFHKTLLGKILITFLAIGGLIVALFWYIVYPVWIVIKWFKYGRDPKVGADLTATFEAPKIGSGYRLVPAETGAIIDETVDQSDILATIVDLARRGYLKIDEREKKDFYLTKERNQARGDTLNDFESDLMDALFPIGEETRVKDLKDIATELLAIQKTIYERLVDKGMFMKNPKKIRDFYAVVSSFALFTFNIPLLLISLIFGRGMPRKTIEGARAAHAARGLKNFLTSQERQLNFQGDKQLLFEKLLPFAIAFGVEKNWIERFASITLQQPNWYVTHGAYNQSLMMNNFSSSFRNFSSATSHATATTSSSSSGFSGGSSGGGGGGGGGGSW